VPAKTLLEIAEVDRLNLQCLACLMSNRQEARRLVKMATAAARAIGYERGETYARLNEMSLAFYEDDVDEAETLCVPLAEHFHATADAVGEMTVQVYLGAIASRRGEFEASENLFEQARLLAAQSPDSLYKFALYSRVGIDALSRGDALAAPRNFLLALDMAERFGTASHRVNSLSNLASSQHDLGNDEDAIPLLSEALEIIGNDRVNHLKPLVSANLAMCYLSAGKPAQALSLVEPYLDAPVAGLAVKAFIFSLAAHASILLERHDSAEHLLARAQGFAASANDYEEQMHAWLVRGRLEFALGRAEQALAALQNAHGLLSYTRNPFYLQQIFKNLAGICAHLEDWRNAYLYLQQYQQYYEAHSRSARDSRIMMRKLEKEMRNLKEERDRALEQQAQRETENQKLESLNKELAHQIHHVNSLQSTLKEQAIRDHLTGLYNRRHFETCLNAVLHEAQDRFPVAVVIVDLDNFKSVNDTYGHHFGDEVLVQFARLMESQLRGSDMICRYGGEEFCLLLREADAPVAVRMLERMALRYRELVVAQGGHVVSGCTFSAGVAEFPRHGGTRSELLMHADTALYAAKMAGRNRAEIADDSFEDTGS
jgi:two-component system cell cycle response regulator